MAIQCRAVLVIIGGVLIHLTLGTLYTFGNLSPYLTSYIRKHESPDLTYGLSVWVFALSAMGQGGTMAVGGVLEKRIGARPTVLLGAWFQSLATLLTYFAVQQSFGLTIFTYGAMFGAGIGVAYAIPLAVGMRWLPNRKGLVNGCVVAGFGGGSFIFDQIQTAYINPDNKSPDQTVDGEKFFTQPDILERVPKVFLILGGTYAVMQLIGCMLLFSPQDSQYQSLEEEIAEPARTQAKDAERLTVDDIRDKSCEQSTGDQTPTQDTERPMALRDIVRNRSFITLWLIFFMSGQGSTFISSLYKAYGQTFISDDVFLAWVGAFSAVCNGTGRIIWGSLADRFPMKTVIACQNGMFTVLMLTLGLTSIGGRWMFLLWVGLLFLAFSGSFSLMPTAIAKCFGQTHVARNYGMLFTSQFFTAGISALLTTSLRSAIGWYGMFFLVAGFSFISVILAISFRHKRADGKDI